MNSIPTKDPKHLGMCGKLALKFSTLDPEGGRCFQTQERFIELRRRAFPRLCRVICTGLVILLAAQAVAQATIDGPSLTVMRKFLEQNGLEIFVQTAQSEQWRSPRIYSEWYVKMHLGGDEEKANVASASRELGSATVRELDNWCLKIRTGGRDETSRRVQTLIGLASWLDQQNSYGTLMLKARAIDLALAGVGRLSVDLGEPEQQLETLVALCEKLAPKANDVASVLNEECQNRIISSKDLDFAQLRAAWEKHISRRRYQALKQKYPNMNAASSSVATSVKALGEQLRAQGVDPDARYPFDEFLDDEPTGPAPSTANCWGGKHHSFIVERLELANLPRLKFLLTFRKAVGDFPLAPKRKDGLYGDSQKAAFVEVWRQRCKPGDELIAFGAWSTYKQIKDGEFLDQDCWMQAKTKLTLSE